jgi:hypothetical protein
MNDLAVLASTVRGVGVVVVAGERLLVSMLDPDAITPHVVRELVLRGADLSRVAEVEYPLEMAYLDLISRYDTDELADSMLAESRLQEALV